MDGGDISLRHSTASIVSKSSIQNNIAGYHGGGIYAESSTLVVADTNDRLPGEAEAISCNIAEFGGGIFILYLCETRIEKNRIINNGSLKDDGGVLNHGILTLVQGSSIQNNTVLRNGGGIFNSNVIVPLTTGFVNIIATAASQEIRQIMA